MSKIIVVDRANVETVADGKMDLSVMEIVRDTGVEDEFAFCGGGLSCASCHVYVDESFLQALPAMSAEEDDLLDGSSHRRENSRLSCQLPYSDALDGLKVAIAPLD